MKEALYIEHINKCKESLSKSKVVCFPTETVMGLGVYFDDYKAYQLLNEIKERPETKPYTLMVKGVDEIEKYAYVDDGIRRVIERFMPGSLTILLKVKDNVPGYVTHNTGVIGIRVPGNKEALDLLKALDKPLLVPSANKSGQQPALNSDEAKRIFSNQVETYFDGECQGGKPSTIVDLSGDYPVFVRKGPIPFEAIECIYNNHKYEETVMCYLFKDNEMLMLFRNKKKVDINKGKWIGVGGHIESGETPDAAMRREFFEETNAKLINMKSVANVVFKFKNDVELMHVYTSYTYEGDINFDCNEGTLKWINISELSNIPMWEGDKYFIKPILNKESFFELLLEYDGDRLVKAEKI